MAIPKNKRKIKPNILKAPKEQRSVKNPKVESTNNSSSEGHSVFESNAISSVRENYFSYIAEQASLNEELRNLINDNEEELSGIDAKIISLKNDIECINDEISELYNQKTESISLINKKKKAVELRMKDLENANFTLADLYALVEIK